jgi:hypothetical protein
MAFEEARDEFNDVQSIFEANATGGTPDIINSLKGFADSAQELALGGVTFLDFTTPVVNDKDTQLIHQGTTRPTAPTEPDTVEMFSDALDYLDWLQAQALVAATFPGVDDVVSATPPTPVEPTLDTSDPSVYSLSTPSEPVYEIPVWDDTSAWSGGDVASDGTVGPLTAPFTWTGGSYTSELLVGGNNVLYDAIVADLQDSSFGMDSLDQGRLWDRVRENEVRQMTQARSDATRLFAAGGFTMPTGAAQAAVDRIENEARDRTQNANRDVLAQKAALLLEAKKVAQEHGLQIETLEQGFFNAENDRLLRRIAQEITSTVEVATFNVERIKMHVEKYAAFARVFESRVSAAKGVVDLFAAQVSAEETKANANKALIEALIAKNQNLINVYNAQLEGFKTVVEARIRYHGVLADVYKSQVSNVNAYTDAVKGAYDLAENQTRRLVEFRVGKYNADIAETKSRVDEIGSYLTMRVDQLKTEMQAAASVAAAAMSALNVNMGLSISGSANITGSEVHSSDITKGTNSGDTTSHVHTYDETKSTNPGTVRQEIDYTSDNESENTNYNYSGTI